jgi:hypothetical protein
MSTSLRTGDLITVEAIVNRTFTYDTSEAIALQMITEAFATRASLSATPISWDAQQTAIVEVLGGLGQSGIVISEACEPGGYLILWKTHDDRSYYHLTAGEQ